MLKETEKKPATPIINQDIGLEVKKNVFIPVPMFLASEKNLENFFNIPVYMSSSKQPTPLNLSLCTLKIKCHHN